MAWSKGRALQTTELATPLTLKLTSSTCAFAVIKANPNYHRRDGWEMTELFPQEGSAGCGTGLGGNSMAGNKTGSKGKNRSGYIKVFLN